MISLINGGKVFLFCICCLYVVCMYGDIISERILQAGKSSVLTDSLTLLVCM